VLTSTSSIKASASKAAVDNLHHPQRDKPRKQAQDSAFNTLTPTTGHQDAQAIHPENLAAESYDDPACSNAEAEFDRPSETPTGGYGMAERDTYQLQQWVYENSDARITLSERLEKSKW
jgi:hypothetical protein